MPYVTPEMLRGNPYTQAADIYNFAIVLPEKQPFGNYTHDEYLALDIYHGIRPEINEQEAPKCYINLMNKCWNSNPDNKPNVIELKESFNLFRDSTDNYHMEMRLRDDETIQRSRGK
ncbi:uncharacterized protein OCT59_011536 [Rhizophagus irregularis]|uniref:uncharacterized protein n=1 Tax=Rhizophagus irregularis TaxID=588596 RepID=UPI000CA72C04|nr:hypothetical protein OCT59_011536 [Rhizophagus irregularis]GBC39052.1 kinase-like domain-containing protein [Rhizophagus irregularis DAOM 181602=DAOM 197198]